MKIQIRRGRGKISSLDGDECGWIFVLIRSANAQLSSVFEVLGVFIFGPMVREMEGLKRGGIFTGLMSAEKKEQGKRKRLKGRNTYLGAFLPWGFERQEKEEKKEELVKV
ncbi:hypothetical protein GOBAR_AA16205 [Gossypium barbadense]|uniref:Uncharacterized protein n=1 Tax=Gossypium barbadense TaxID=3634 RepID=A0A2P5XMB6_GOSBA|nr:hypothetical protein GOBAR_AA16205 [Gossypium barbadense]